ncbi:G-box-binding factor-like [Helianthus annuus]|uniref:G-box-binding factor-like n=1 Tax=Helianthus annuus TaxID=4232 RepID=UPI000B8FF3F5|nr:G-box-binding factor-like [Helianthus annuus]
MGGPSNHVSKVNFAQVAPPSPPHMGFDNPIPSYAGAAAYNPFEQPGHSGYNYYNTPDVDPYLVAANYNALHPEGPYGAPYQTGYPAYGYQYPPPPQALQQQQPQPPQIQPLQQQEILQRLSQVEQEVQEERRSHRGFLKGLQSSYMAESEEVNSHPIENHDTTRINITGEELRALIDNAVAKAMDRQLRESSGTHSKTLSVPHSKSHPKTHSEAHSKPPSKHHESKKDDAQHSSKQHSVPPKKIAYLTSFNTMSRLVPYLVTPEPKRLARFIGGLAPEIKASVKASRPTTFRFVADLSLSLTLDAVR